MPSGIDHLIINFPYEEPRQHWEYNHERMAFELAEGRRPSGYTVASTERRLINDAGDMKAWDTSKPFVHTRKSHINFCVCDSRWESTAALHLDRSPHISAWVKNDHLGFEVGYIFNGGGHKYRPDFLAKLSNDEIIVIEIKGEEDQKDKVKREAMREWIRAVNQHGGFGRWHSEPAVSKRPDDIPQILERAMKAFN